MAEAARMALETARNAGAKRITCLRLRVGALSGAEPQAMQFAWDVVSDNTIAEGARLEIVSVSAVAWCDKCQTEFASANYFNECPNCHVVSRKLLRGRELDIAAVEIE